MEFRISRENFLTGVQKVQGIVETKGAMPILSHLLVSTDNEGIYIQATDLEIGIKGFYPANVITQGALALNARKLFDIVRELPEQEIHVSGEENNWITLRCGNSKFRLPGLPAEDFPALPEYSEEGIMEFRAPLLREMIRKTIFAISPDESRPALNGLLLEREENQATLVGTDGHRLALIQRPLPASGAPGAEKLSLILPKKALAELLKMMENDEAVFSFSVKNNHLAFIQGKQVIVSRKIEGKFPNYRQVVPKDHDLKIQLAKDDFSHALKRVSLLADEKSKMVRFEARQGALTLIADNSDYGAAREEIPVSFKGDEMFIGLNAKYLLDVLAAVDQEKITLNLKDQNHPCLITVDDDKDYLSIVMPMRL
ncbi:MAG: DNA polymerase III subunit beta [Nitrospinae bacterium]|nr:DNA polymerase III subunit beta [Nitrospinota bacterium]